MDLANLDGKLIVDIKTLGIIQDFTDQGNDLLDGGGEKIFHVLAAEQGP